MNHMNKAASGSDSATANTVDANVARLRRLASQGGLHITKSRRRKQEAADFGMFRLVDAPSGDVLFGGTLDELWTLDEIEACVPRAIGIVDGWYGKPPSISDALTHARDAYRPVEKLRAELASRDGDVAAAFAALDPSPQFRAALECLYVLNLHARVDRDVSRAQEYVYTPPPGRPDTRSVTYVLKNELLDLIVQHGKATRVEISEHVRHRSVEWMCSCGRSWFGRNGGYHACHEDADSLEDPTETIESAVVQVGLYRWHQPGHAITAAMRAVAVPGASHDPAQPARSVPNIDLPIEVQQQIVALLIAQLRPSVRASSSDRDET